MMAITGYQLLIGAILFLFSVDLPQHVFGDTVCSGESSDVEPEHVLREVLTTCFPSAPRLSHYAYICSGQYLNCNSLRKVFQVIPSCDYCSHSGVDETLCLNSQLNATQCSVSHLVKSFQCTKYNGKSCPQCSVSYGTVSLTSSAENDTPTTTRRMVATDDNLAGLTESYKYHPRKCPTCEPCNCEQKEDEDGGVSVGTAVGLFIIGLIMGIVATSVLCICVPSLHSKSSILRGKMREKISRHSIHEEKPPSQQSQDQPATNIPPPTGANSQVLPSAPPATGSFQTGYHTLDMMSNPRDSHMYTGLQPNSNIYQEPMGEGETYEEPDNQPIRGKNSVQSPVYQELPDDVIPNSGPQKKHKNSPNNNSSTADMDRNGAADYSGDQRPLSDHHYFILEEQNSQPDSETQTTDTPYHDYFVLEKEET